MAKKKAKRAPAIIEILRDCGFRGYDLSRKVAPQKLGTSVTFASHGEIRISGEWIIRPARERTARRRAGSDTALASPRRHKGSAAPSAA